jgi:hypothetical protein
MSKSWQQQDQTSGIKMPIVEMQRPKRLRKYGYLTEVLSNIIPSSLEH